MTRKYYSDTMQSNPWQREEETHNTNSDKIAKLERNLVLHNKTRTKHTNNPQTTGATINQHQQNYRLRMNSSCLHASNLRPRFS